MKWTRKAETRPIPPIGRRRFPRDLWDYEPVGPKFTLECASAEGASYDSESWGEMDAVIHRFVELAVPVWPYWNWMVVDSARTVILGYSATDQAFDEYGPWGWWVGVQAAFEVLTRFHDPMEVAVWETIAKERAWT